MLDANSLIADLGFPEHLGWFAHYVADDGRSHYTLQAQSDNPDAQPAVLTNADNIRSVLCSCSPAEPVTVADLAALAMARFVIGAYILSTSTAGCAALFALLLAVMSLLRLGFDRCGGRCARLLLFMWVVAAVVFAVDAALPDPRAMFPVNRADAALLRSQFYASYWHIVLATKATELTPGIALTFFLCCARKQPEPGLLL